jgi:hypothetical protein
MSTTKLKNLLANFFLLAFILIIIFIISEITIRSLFKDQTVLFPRYHTDVQYGEYTLRKIRPNTEFWHTSIDGKWKFTINNQGLRNNKDIEYEKPKGVTRILSLGDSHTQGYEVSQSNTFSAIIDKYLNTNGYKTEVINSGVSGFSTAEELIYLENEGIKYNPDVVVLGFYANDYQDNIKAGLFKLDENNNLIIGKKKHIPGVKVQNIIYSLPMIKWLSENSYFYSVLFNTTWKFFKALLLSAKASESSVEYAVPTQEEFTKYQTDLTTALIKRMYAFCQKNNIKFIIVDIPKDTDENTFESSITVNMSDTITEYSDSYISSKPLLADYNGVAEIHRPHGLKHISDFTHTILGISIAKEVISFNLNSSAER